MRVIVRQQGAGVGFRDTLAGRAVGFILVIIGLTAGITLPLSGQDRPDALAEYNNGNYERALEICLIELKEMPRNMDAYSVLGWSLIALDRYQEALEYGQRALEISRYDVRIIEIVAEAYYFMGDNLKALSYFEEYAALAPTGTRIEVVYYYMGEIFIRIGEFNHADIAFTTALYHSPNYAAWWTRLGYAREMAESFSGAEEAYDQALALNPNNREAQRGLRRVREKLENGL